MRRVVICIALAVTATLCAPAMAAGPRIASINLCTDQLLIALADPDQILGLSPYVRDASQSWAAAKAAHYPALSGGAEDVLVLKPDLVLASRFDKRATRELLKKFGLHVAEFEVPRTLAEVKAQILQMGELTGHLDRARAQVARLDTAVARAKQAAARKPYRVLPVSRRGWISGRDSLISSVMSEIGLVNAAGDLGVSFGGYVALESIISLQPDFILVADDSDVAEDDGRAFLLHPALEHFYPLSKRIVLPERLTVCGGPMLADALDVLAKQLARVERAGK